MALPNSYSKHPDPSDVAPVMSKAAGKSRTGNATLQYQRTQVETASPTRLVIMLYEGAMRFCQLASDAMAVQDLLTQHENLIRAQRIVAELLGSLNREKGGEVAENLARLYTHMLEQLVVANLHDQPEPIQKVQSMLRDLWTSWIEVERLTEEGKSGGLSDKGKGVSDDQSTIHNPQSTIGNTPRLGRLNA
jgi:flagellar protein FliS